MINDNVVFEVLAIDTKDNCSIKTDKNLCYALLGHGYLWKNPSHSDTRITDGSIKCKISPVKADADMAAIFSKGFLLTVEGNYQEVEPLRSPLINHLKEQRFDSIYILTDHASQNIACELYPLVYKAENLLRHYLIKFMVTRLGPNWWDVTATSELAQKVRNRKNNEPIFGELIDNKSYLIDFGDLGKMIYAHSSGFTTKDDIVKKLLDLEETTEAIKKFKEQLQSNYQKFFKESFKDKNFQEQWEKLEKLRNKIAHNSLFNSQDLIDGKILAEELITLINEADKTVASVPLDEDEKTAIKESFVSQGYAWNVITEEIFLKELQEQEDRYKQKYPDGFVGFASFVKKHLGLKGYDYNSSFELADRLEAKGAIERYKVKNYADEDHPTTAIKLSARSVPTSP